MSYIIRGSLCGLLCDDCFEPLHPVEIVLYRPWQPDAVLEHTVASTKDTFRPVTTDEQKSREKLRITSTHTNEHGHFELEVDEQYAKTALDIDFVCSTVPHARKPPRRQSLQFHLTTFYPKWIQEREKDNLIFKWDYCIPHNWWCFIRGHYFDAWVICGHLRNCQTGAPIANASVSAWDADLLSDDHLGSAVTDAAGHFRIDYTSADFKVNFIPFNLETDPSAPFFSSGPDVYFKAELGGVLLIDEKSADRRNNVGYCLCVSLCTAINVGGEGGVDFPSAWTGVGSAFHVSFGSGPKDFDANGYAGNSKYALSHIIRLTGQAATHTSAGHAVEYRFLVSDAPTSNGGAAPTLSSFTKIIGVTPGLFVASTVAKLMEKTFPFAVYDVVSDQADFDANGWFDMNNALARTQSLHGLGALSNYWFIDEDTLVALDTRALTTQPNVPAGVANAGDAFPPGSKIPIEKIALRFEIREVVNKPANLFNVMPGNGKTLNSAIINNNASFIKLAVHELDTLGSCSPVSGTIHAKYTVHHPHLQSVSMHVHNNSYSVNKSLSDSFIPVSGNTNAAINAGNNAALQINATPNDLVRCTYALTLYVQRRLHTGDVQLNHEEAQVLFFYDI